MKHFAMIVAAALSLSTSLAAGPAPLALARSGEEFLWRSGHYYCAHFRATGQNVTVHRSEIVEGVILISHGGTVAALPEAYAALVEKRAPEMAPVRISEVRCFHFRAKRNLAAQVERQSGLGAKVMTYRGERLATVSKSVTIGGFAAPAAAALKAWRPRAGSTIYGAMPCGSGERAPANPATDAAATCRPPKPRPR